MHFYSLVCECRFLCRVLSASRAPTIWQLGVLVRIVILFFSLEFFTSDFPVLGFYRCKDWVRVRARHTGFVKVSKVLFTYHGIAYMLRKTSYTWSLSNLEIHHKYLVWSS